MKKENHYYKKIYSLKEVSETMNCLDISVPETTNLRVSLKKLQNSRLK